MDSAPPARMISALPARMRSAAMAMDCRPELQKRLMVTPGTRSGSPARRAAQRAMLLPDSPSGMAQPRITSSMSSCGTCGYSSRRRRITAAARSSGRAWRKVPRGALPTAVRRQSMITASCIAPLCVRSPTVAARLIPQGLSGFQHVLHALLGLRLAAQTQEGLPLQVEQVLFRDGLLAGDPAAAQHVGQLLSYYGIVLGDVLGLTSQVDAGLQQGIVGVAADADIGAGHAGLPVRDQRKRQSLGVGDEPLRIHGDTVLRAQQAEFAGLFRGGGHLGVSDQFEGFLGVAQAQEEL